MTADAHISPQAQAHLDEQAAMVLWREIFFLREKIRHHIQKAMNWQVRIEQMESAADIEGPRRAQGRLSTKDDVQDPAYQVGAVLRDRTDYKLAVGNRNANENQANMFSAALTALMISCPPQLRDFDVPGMEFFVQRKTKEEVPPS
jgi:hypothetical protein